MNNKYFWQDNMYIVSLTIITIISIGLIFVFNGPVNNQNMSTNNSPNPGGQSTSGGEVDFMKIAGMQLPVAVSFVNQIEGEYTYCGISDMNDVFVENGINYRASSNFKNIDDVKHHLKRILTESMINKYFINEESAYIERNDKLYCSYALKQDESTIFFNENAIETIDNPAFEILNDNQNSFDAKLSFDYNNHKVNYTFTFINSGEYWLINEKINAK